MGLQRRKMMPLARPLFLLPQTRGEVDGLEVRKMGGVA